MPIVCTRRRNNFGPPIRRRTEFFGSSDTTIPTSCFGIQFYRRYGLETSGDVGTARIDIGWRDLLAAAGYALFPGSRERRRSNRRSRRGPAAMTSSRACRCAADLDLMLGRLGLPAGSEVLVSAVTIEDMVTILRHHGLVAVPMDVNPTDMSPSFKDIDRAITSRTKAMLIAHLFGTRLPVTAVRQKSSRARVAAVGGLRPSLRWPLRRVSRSGRSDVQLRPDQDPRDGARRWTVACA